MAPDLQTKIKNKHIRETNNRVWEYLQVDLKSNYKLQSRFIEENKHETLLYFANRPM